jgi:hypothetical protein
MMVKRGSFFGKSWNDKAGRALIPRFAGHNQTFPLAAPRFSPSAGAVLFREPGHAISAIREKRESDLAD